MLEKLEAALVKLGEVEATDGSATKGAYQEVMTALVEAKKELEEKDRLLKRYLEDWRNWASEELNKPVGWNGVEVGVSDSDARDLLHVELVKLRDNARAWLYLAALELDTSSAGVDPSCVRAALANHYRALRGKLEGQEAAGKLHQHKELMVRIERDNWRAWASEYASPVVGEDESGSLQRQLTVRLQSEKAWGAWARDLEANLSASGPGEPPSDVEVRASISRYFDQTEKARKQLGGYLDVAVFAPAASAWMDWARETLQQCGVGVTGLGPDELRNSLRRYLSAQTVGLERWRTWALTWLKRYGESGAPVMSDGVQREALGRCLAKTQANAEWRTWALDLPLISKEERDRYLAAGDEAIRSLVSMRIMAPMAPSDQELGRALAVSMNRVLLWRRWAGAEFNLAHVDDDADGDAWIMRQVSDKTRFTQGKLAKIRGIVG